jgi:hypothetical protein
MNAVNMDTGYVNYLNDAEKKEVLAWTREALGKEGKFIAGAYIEGQDGDVVDQYRREIDRIVELDGIRFSFRRSVCMGEQRGKKRLPTKPCAEAIHTCWPLN